MTTILVYIYITGGSTHAWYMLFLSILSCQPTNKKNATATATATATAAAAAAATDTAV
jgi:hypothetical protein